MGTRMFSAKLPQAAIQRKRERGSKRVVRRWWRTRQAAAKALNAAGVTRWLQGAKADARAERNARIKALWLRCHSEREIAEALNVAQQTVHDQIVEITENCQMAEIGNFQPLLYNYFASPKLGDANDHKGHSDSRIVENLIHTYCDAVGDVVVDPFAGSGSTLAVCEPRGIRCWLGDRAPAPRFEHEVRKHDIVVDGMPRLPWRQVRLVYLDPPYWRQAEGAYSADKEDLANMPLDEFHTALVDTINAFAAKMERGHIALIIQATQWLAPNRKTVDHATEVFRRLELPLVERVECPYNSEQYNAQQVEWAKANKRRLVVNRVGWPPMIASTRRSRLEREFWHDRAETDALGRCRQSACKRI